VTSLVSSPDVVYNADSNSDRPLINTLPTQLKIANMLNFNNSFFNKWLSYHSNNYNMNVADDAKSYTNPFKTFFKFNNTKKLFLKDGLLGNTDLSLDELVRVGKARHYSWSLFNDSRSYRFKDIKSSNMQFLSPDKNTRLGANKSLSSSNVNFNYNTNVSQIISQGSSIGSGLYENYSSSEVD
jgi:hypothetical protein